MIVLTGIESGSKLRIVGGSTAEVLEVVSDEWVRVRVIDASTPGAAAGAEELCHATDIVEVL